VLVYNAVSGAVRMDVFNAGGKGTTNVWAATWAPGWTTVATLGGDRFFPPSSVLLVYNRGSGAVRIDTFNDDGKGTTNVWSTTWAPGWTTVAAFAGSEFLPSVLLVYNNGSGAVRMDTFNDGWKGTTNVWKSTWKAGWSTFEFFSELEGNLAHLYGLQYEERVGSVEVVLCATAAQPT